MLFFMDRLRFWRALPLLSLAPLYLGAQGDVIHFVNPSFEDLPKSGDAPVGWYDCGKTGETPPDVQPGFYSVNKPPKHGDTYLGLVVRDNDTWEAVAQRLSKPIAVNHCYDFTVDICRSEIYVSASKTTGQQANYTRPCRLLIWGGYGFCDKKELLYQSAEVTHDRWLTTPVRLAPKNGSYTHLLFEAYYMQPTLFAYNGNILLDNLTPIQELDCNPVAMTGTPKPTSSGTAGSRPTGTSSGKTGTSANPSTPTGKSGATSTASTAKSVPKKGDIIRIDKLYFEANQFEIKPESEEALQSVLKFLKNNPRVVVEIGGHTNNWAAESFAVELSTNRAKAVADWLIDQGIPSGRVQYKGYGWKQPVTSNDSVEGRNKNQRVEIKILSTDG